MNKFFKVLEHVVIPDEFTTRGWWGSRICPHVASKGVSQDIGIAGQRNISIQTSPIKKLLATKFIPIHSNLHVECQKH